MWIRSCFQIFRISYDLTYDITFQRTTSLEATNDTDVQQQNSTQATNNMFNTSSGYSLIEEQHHTQATNNIYGDYSLFDTSTLLQLQQAQMSNIMSQSQVADLF